MTDQLTDNDEILYRQVHPSFVQDGIPSSQTFMPTPKDKNMLSVDRSSLTSAAESYTLFTSGGLKSQAIYGLSVAEFQEQGIACISDPITGDPDREDNLAHALADYSAHTEKVQKVKAKKLKAKAVARGKLHP